MKNTETLGAVERERERERERGNLKTQNLSKALHSKEKQLNNINKNIVEAVCFR